MQLIVILLATVSILTILSGLIVFFGSTKKDRIRSLWFLVAAFFATIWVVAIAFFLAADESFAESIHWHITWSFVSAILFDIAFLAYAGWQQKYGKIITLISLVFGLIISTFIIMDPSSLYTNLTFASTGNSMTIVVGPVFFAYSALFSVTIPAIIFMFFRQVLHPKSKESRQGSIITMASYIISSLVIMVCNFILPLLGNWSLSWLGPLAVAFTIITIYYTILRYQVFAFSSIWLKIFSYVVIFTTIAIVYMIIFSVIFAALFRGSTPSLEVIILNFIMILIFLCLTPAINSLIGTIHQLGTPATAETSSKKGTNGSQHS